MRGMMAIQEVDRAEVLVLVDNVTDNLSTGPAFVETEIASAWRRGMRLMSGKCLCCAAHGLSCLITLHVGDATRTLLFDTGPEEWVFERNVTRLGADLGQVGAMVLSHGHWDHAGAMPRALQMITQRNGGRDVPTYMHPGMFARRAMKAPDGAMRPFEDVPSVSELTLNGAAVVSTAEPLTILDGTVFVSGEIPRVTSFEEGLPGQYRRSDDDRDWEPDPLLMDERFVAIHVRSKGLVVFSACSHAGIVNVLHHAGACFPGIPVYGVMGGLHLSGVTEKIIPATVDGMKAFAPSIVAAGHCTGWRGLHALVRAFGEGVVVPSAVGKRYTF